MRYAVRNAVLLWFALMAVALYGLQGSGEALLPLLGAFGVVSAGLAYLAAGRFHRC